MVIVVVCLSESFSIRPDALFDFPFVCVCVVCIVVVIVIEASTVGPFADLQHARPNPVVRRVGLCASAEPHTVNSFP